MTETSEFKKELEKCKGRELLKQYLAEQFDENLLGIFDALTNLYLQVNAVINISALKTLDDIYIKHYLDSIVAHEFFDGTCCDVGCGGGFPCLPLSIVKPDSSFLGIDGVGKKLTLINRCVSELGIKNIKSLHSRSEDLERTGKLFDTVCARAVAHIIKVLCYCAPLAKPGGKIVLYKSCNDEDSHPLFEKRTNCKLSEIKEYSLPGTDIKRRLFIYDKL